MVNAVSAANTATVTVRLMRPAWPGLVLVQETQESSAQLIATVLLTVAVGFGSGLRRELVKSAAKMKIAAWD